MWYNLKLDWTWRMPETVLTQCHLIHMHWCHYNINAPLKLTLGMHTGWAHPAHQGGLPFVVPSQWRGRSWCPGSSPTWDQRCLSASYTPGIWLQQGIGRKIETTTYVGHTVAVIASSIFHTFTKILTQYTTTNQWYYNIHAYQEGCPLELDLTMHRCTEYILVFEHIPSLQKLHIRM